ncbi:MYXO-CTERM sorting domain-containing protein [Polyangium sorediatum]|uniref:MYXO-CTERM sorting domain-containing protein n=1 Tax=Polyangium sorediatum TaxID=889274 RepID=UPI0010BDC2D7
MRAGSGSGSGGGSGGAGGGGGGAGVPPPVNGGEGCDCRVTPGETKPLLPFGAAASLLLLARLRRTTRRASKLVRECSKMERWVLHFGAGRPQSEIRAAGIGHGEAPK